MKTTFEHIARTTLGENISVGKFSSIRTTAVPGVYHVSRKAIRIIPE